MFCLGVKVYITTYHITTIYFVKGGDHDHKMRLHREYVLGGSAALDTYLKRPHEPRDL